jgi:endonuclease/exonuclease/phosphatase family metal-dependent hydrolase
MPLTVATFNVKNLLPPKDERERSVLPEKLDAIARTLEECDADVVGLEEVGSGELVQAAVSRMGRAGGYGEPLLGPADQRGIRCALLSRHPVPRVRVHTASALTFPAFAAGDPAPFGARLPLRRGVVHARVMAPGAGAVEVMLVHFKSPRPVAERDTSGRERLGDRELAQAAPRARAEGALRSFVWRAAEALHVRGIVDEVLLSPAVQVVVLGDMNDSPESPTLRTLRSSGDGALFDCAARIEPAARFSILHEGRPEQVDHVLASTSLFERLESARFLNAALRDHGMPGRRASEADAMTVDSDHAALVVRFG